MSDLEPVEAHEYVVAIEYSLFELDTGLVPGGDATDPFARPQHSQPDDPIELLNARQTGIAQGQHTVLVTSPAQNVDVALRVETWTHEPPADLDYWADVSEFVVDIGQHGLLYSSPTLDVTPLAVPSGRHRLRISGRELPSFFDEHGYDWDQWRWRLQLWPTTTPSGPQRLKTWQPDGPASQ